VLSSAFPDDRVPEPAGRWTRRLLQSAAIFAVVVSTGWLLWRLTCTLEGATLVLAVPLWLLELHALFSLALHVHDLWDVDAGPEPGQWSGTHKVAVLVPTYNESREVLLPTVAAAVAIDGDHETWVLDDGERAWVRQMAAELGARYHCRVDRGYAKAGNINDVLPRLREDGVDLVLVLDADHVASRSFLRRVLGYFDDPRVALVQTPQDFYNEDSFEHIHTGWFGRRFDRVLRRSERTLRFNEQELFYRGLAPGRNRWNAAFWCGTNAVLRLDALASVGDVSTDSVTEDIQTTLRLHARGWSTVYHNEVLARGLAAANAEQYLTQRLRWGTGAMQVLRSENPLLSRGLTVRQRLSYLSTLTGWFESWRTLGYAVLPVLTVLFAASPIAAPLLVFLPAFLLVTVLQRTALRMLARGRTTVLHSTLFEFLRMSAALRATLTLFSSRERRFVVTSKGREGDSRSRMPMPRLLTGLTAASVFALVWFPVTLAGLTPAHYSDPWIPAGALIWVALNVLVMIAAIRRIRRVEFGVERRASVRFTVDAVADLDGFGTRVQDVSLSGARLVCDQTVPWQAGDAVHMVLTLPTGPWAAPATLRLVEDRPEGGLLLGVEFTDISMREQGELALALFRTADLVDPTLGLRAYGVVQPPAPPAVQPAV
jgi:cellulose synthase (UDP-forming)